MLRVFQRERAGRGVAVGLACALACAPWSARAQDVLPDLVVEADAVAEEARDPSVPAGAEVVPLHGDGTWKGAGIKDALDAAPGVRMVRAGGEGAAFNLSVRGLQGRRVATYLGPVRLDDPATGILDLGEVPAGALQDAVLVRGATASSEGALGGALLLRPRAAVVPVARASFTYGAENLWASDVAAGGPVTRGRFTGGVTAMARGSTTDGRFMYAPVVGPREAPVVLPERERVNNDRRRVGFTLLGAGEWLGGPSMEAVLDVADVEGGIPGFGVQPLQSAREKQTRGVGGVTITGPAWRGLRARVELGSRMATWRFSDTRPGARVDGGLLTAASHGVFSVETDLFPLLRAGAGVRGALDAAVARGDAGGYRGVRPTAGAFGTLALALLDGRFTTEARTVANGWMVAVSSEGLPGKAPSAPAPRVVVTPELRSALRLPGGVTLHAAMVRAWRNPTLEELYRPTNAPLGGNPGLLPEEGTEGSTGVRWEAGPLHASMAAYAARMDNVIAFVNVNAFDVRPMNIGAAWRAGGELAAGARLGDWVDVRGGADVQWSRVLASGAAIPNVPLFDVRAALLVGPPRARILVEGSARSGTAGNFHGELPVRPMARANAGVMLQLLPGVGAQAMVRNVLDDRTQTDTWGMPLPGREVFMTVNVDPGSVLGGAGW